MKILPQTLVLLTCVVSFGECQRNKKLTFKKPIHIENAPCATISNFINKKGKEASTKKSQYTRTSVGIDENLLGEDKVMGLREHYLHGFKPQDVPKQEHPHGIVLTDPEGRKHFLKNWLHIRIDLSEHIHSDFIAESLIVQISRRALHTDWLNTAAQGQFVADFPGYDKCANVLKDYKSKVTVRPSPRQFVPCQGATAGDHEYSNIYVYNLRAEKSHGGSGKRAQSKSFQKVHHLFWKFNENSCSRKHNEFYLELFLNTRYHDKADEVQTIYMAPYVIELGNVFGEQNQYQISNVPAQGSDPMPIGGDNWRWNCEEELLISNKKGGWKLTHPEFRWVNSFYPTVEQSISHGEMGSCKVDGLEDDDSFSQYGNQFYGRCKPVKGAWQHSVDAVYTPSPNIFHHCSEEHNMKKFQKGGKIPTPQYGEQFGVKADKTGIKPTVADVCGQCPGYPWMEDLKALFPEVEEQGKRERSRREKAKTQRMQPASLTTTSTTTTGTTSTSTTITIPATTSTPTPGETDEERRKRERLQEELERNATREQRFKEFTVRFDDEDDGWWPRRWQKKLHKNAPQRQRSPVAMVGLSVWRYRKLHGIFEVIVAFFLTPVCVFVSRYFKETCLGWRVLEQPAWLMGHLSLSMMSLIFHIFGVHSGVMGVGLMGSSRRQNVINHRYLGFGTLLLFFLLNLLGAFRPVGLCARRCCIILHWFFGLLAYALNFVCVLTSINIPGSPSADIDVSLPTEKRKDGDFAIVFVLTIVWIVLDILFHVVANVLIVMSDAREQVKRAYFPVLMPCVDEDELIDTEGSFSRKVLLSLYVIVCSLMTIAVVGVIYSQVPNGRAFFNMTLTHNETGDLYADLIKENGKEMAFYFPPFF